MAVQIPASSPSTSTPDSTSIIKKVEDLAETLQSRGAKDGAQRLKVVAKQYQHFTVEGASQYLRRDEIVEELEDQPHFWLSTFRFFRNVLSIAPIVITWIALGLAASAYQSDLADSRYYSEDRYQPFLYLWQTGFHGNHGNVIPFSFAAGLDAFFLILLVISIIAVPYSEWRHRNKIYNSLENFDQVIDELLDLISRDGANSHLAESDVNKISNAIKAQLDRVMLNYKQVAVQSSELVKDTHQKTQDLIQKFNTDLGVFNSEVTTLSGGLHKLDNNLDSYGQKLTELTEASNKLAGSSTDLALNAKSMAESATESAKASQGISTQLGALSTAQQEIVTTQKQVADTIAQSQQQVAAKIAQTQDDVATTIAQSQQQVVAKIEQTQDDVVKQFGATQLKVVQEIETSQKSVTKDITGVADKMDESSKNTRDVAQNLDRVAHNLESLTRADFQAMTDGVKQSNQELVKEVQQVANQAARVVGALAQVDAQLQGTTKALADAAKSMRVATKHWWQFWA